MKIKTGMFLIALLSFGFLPSASYACLIITGGDFDGCAVICQTAGAAACILSADLSN